MAVRRGVRTVAQPLDHAGDDRTASRSSGRGRWAGSCPRRPGWRARCRRRGGAARLAKACEQRRMRNAFLPQARNHALAYRTGVHAEPGRDDVASGVLGGLVQQAAADAADRARFRRRASGSRATPPHWAGKRRPRGASRVNAVPRSRNGSGRSRRRRRTDIAAAGHPRFIACPARGGETSPPGSRDRSGRPASG
jgi:hypothetical protein